MTISAVESRNKIRKQVKDMLLEDLSPNKIKMSVIFILNHMNNSLIMQKLYIY